MLKASKKNRVVRIPDEKKSEYAALGYTITEMDGTVVYEPENTAKEAAALKAENEALKAELAALKGESESEESAETAETASTAKTRKTTVKKTAEK